MLTWYNISSMMLHNLKANTSFFKTKIWWYHNNPYCIAMAVGNILYVILFKFLDVEHGTFFAFWYMTNKLQNLKSFNMLRKKFLTIIWVCGYKTMDSQPWNIGKEHSYLITTWWAENCELHRISEKLKTLFYMQKKILSITLSTT